MGTDQTPTVLRRARREFLEVTLRWVWIRPEDFRHRKPAWPELPLHVVAVPRVRRPVAALSAHNVLARLRFHAFVRIEVAQYSPPVTRISRGAGMIVAVLGMASAEAPTDKTVVTTKTVAVLSFMFPRFQ